MHLVGGDGTEKGAVKEEKETGTDGEALVILAPGASLREHGLDNSPGGLVELGEAAAAGEGVVMTLTITLPGMESAGEEDSTLAIALEGTKSDRGVHASRVVLRRCYGAAGRRVPDDIG